MLLGLCSFYHKDDSQSGFIDASLWAQQLRRQGKEDCGVRLVLAKVAKTLPEIQEKKKKRDCGSDLRGRVHEDLSSIPSTTKKINK
jgi:hypothetical protein